MKSSKRNRLEEQDGALWLNNEKVAPKSVEVKYRIRLTDDVGKSQLAVSVTFFCSRDNPNVLIFYDDLVKGQIVQYIPPQWLLLTVMDKQLEKLLCNYILSKMGDCQELEWRSLHQGFNHFPDATLCLLGDRVISTEQQYNCRKEDSGYAMVPCNTAEEACKKWLSELMHTDSIPLALLMAAMVPFTLDLLPNDKRQMYEFSTIIVGESGIGKTEIAKLFVGWFRDTKTGRDDVNCISLNSDMQSINMLAEFIDCCVLIDDLNILNDADEFTKKETKLSRQISAKQGVGYKSKGTDVGIKAMIFATAEINRLPNNLTNRSLIINLSEAFPSDTMQYLKNNKSAYIGLITNFIAYVCNNRADLSEMVTENLESIKYDDSQCENYVGYYRVRNIQAILEETLNIFELFYHKGKQIADYYFPNPLINNIKTSISDCIEDTLERLIKGSTKDAISFIKKLSELIVEDRDKLITSDRDLFVDSVNSKSPPYPILKDKEKKMYYVTIDQARVITGTNLSNKAIAEYMNIEDLIEVGNDGKTKKAFKKEGCDKRFLCIYKKAIKDYYKRTHHADE